ncbi:hypothetical protein PRIC1_001783 [Phytophthora ramorum]|uniref:uncharacterized protein n=1 Tax=Phytophthora ramorum TaxID=164328 RepID=UPI00309B5136|nr:hypothetical protein KRP23_13292 [Phytophthora ramorum]KAH7509466.1 hypothetical protein KRP22_967 [Phytophthora ramorum]
MERFGGGLRKGAGGLGTAAAAGKPSASPAKGKFKLRVSKDPPPLLTKKELRGETKPKATFLKAPASGAPTEKQSSTKSGIFATSSNFRPPTTEDTSKMRTGFSFMKFQPKSDEPKKSGGNTSGKAAPQAFGGSKLLLNKFSVNVLKTNGNPATQAGTKPNKGPLHKPPAKGGLPPFAFRAETKSSVAKKRKAVDLSLQEGRKNYFPSKSGRTDSSGSFSFKNFALNKENGAGKQPRKGEMCSEGAPRNGLQGSFPLAEKKTSMVAKANDGAVPKKRGFLLTSAESGPAPKRSKQLTQIPALQPRTITSNVASDAIHSGDSPREVALGDENAGLPPLSPSGCSAAQASPVRGPTCAQPTVVVLRSPDYQEECLSGIEEELAMKLLCTLDDDKDDEFLTRVAAIEEFTDRVGLEQKQIRSRLLDAHADVSEVLLDALTGLMAEEGGIGIDKLDFDMNIDVDVGDTFLQDDVIQVLD